jgi:hypothetical protein
MSVSGFETTPPASEALGVSNPAPGEFESRGRTLVRTKYPYQFASNNTDLPVVTRDGVRVNREQADALVTESDGLVFVDNTDKEEG